MHRIHPPNIETKKPNHHEGFTSKIIAELTPLVNALVYDFTRTINSACAVISTTADHFRNSLSGTQAIDIAVMVLYIETNFLADVNNEILASCDCLF